jgi:glycosyltransferase involved in cell wall biosynthesis
MSYPHRPEGVAGDNRALVLPWETTLLPDGFAEMLNRNLEWVIAPSMFCTEVLQRSGVDTAKVVYVPHGVDSERFHPAVKPSDLTRLPRDVYYNRSDLDLIQDSLFVFLHLGAAGKRKGTDVLLDAYLSEFTGHDPVLLVIKSPVISEAEDWARSKSERHPDAPRLLYVRDGTPASLLPGYYTAADCLVHPCRGEGFGLPILEAMACGRPAIVTQWSGPTDFCSAESAYLLPYTLVQAREFHVPVPPESLWAEPDLGQLRALLRHVVANHDEARHKGTLAARDAGRWTWRHSALTLIRETRSLPESRDANSGGLA